MKVVEYQLQLGTSSLLKTKDVHFILSLLLSVISSVFLCV